jgi:hypothetical protein
MLFFYKNFLLDTEGPTSLTFHNSRKVSGILQQIIQTEGARGARWLSMTCEVFCGVTALPSSDPSRMPALFRLPTFGHLFLKSTWP